MWGKSLGGETLWLDFCVGPPHATVDGELGTNTVANNSVDRNFAKLHGELGTHTVEENSVDPRLTTFNNQLGTGDV